MDQDIEAQAKEFLAFLKQCSQQPRSKASSELTACLGHLHEFLTHIQPMIEPWPFTDDFAIDSKTAHASELYPTLGPLLEHLCVNPIVMAAVTLPTSSEQLADLVAQSVIKFSTKSNNTNAVATPTGSASSIHSGTRVAALVEPPSTEIAWRAARMRDMFQTKRNQEGQHKKGTIYTSSNQRSRRNELNGSRMARKDSFQDLFQVSDKEMKEKRTEQLLMTMAVSLNNLQDQLADKDLTGTVWKSMATWTRQLSELCAPLVSTPSAVELIRGIISTAYMLGLKKLQGIAMMLPQDLVDTSFVESLVTLQNDISLSTALLSNPTLTELLVLSPHCRHSFLVQLVDKIIQDCGNSLDFYQSQQLIQQRYFDPSHFLKAIFSGEILDDQHYFLIERIIEDIAELVGEVEDWRVVRIWILLIQWILTYIRSEGLKSSLSSGSNTSEVEQGTEFRAMVWSASHIVQSLVSVPKESRFSRTVNNDVVFLELKTLLEIQDRYIFMNSPPREVALRRRLVFLVRSAVLSYCGLLTTMIYHYFLAMSCDHSKKNLAIPLQELQDTTVLLKILTLLSCGDSSSVATTTTIEQSYMILLKELFSSLSASEDTNPYDLRLKTVTNLETIFVKFVPLLRLNLVVTADIVCAVVMYNDPENAAFWQSMINMMLRILTDSESTPLLTSLPGFMAEFRDLSEAMSISGLAVALNTLLATPASFMAKNSSLSMDISQ